MTFAERFSQLLQHLLRNLLQRRQSVWKALLWGAVTVVVIGFVAGLGTAGYPLQNLPPINRLADYHPPLVNPLCAASQPMSRQLFVARRIPLHVDQLPTELGMP